MVAQVRKEKRTSQKRCACIRCRMLKLPCVSDPSNPDLPCARCANTRSSIYSLSCHRVNLPDTPLFRVAMYNAPFYRKHHLVGNDYGDFRVPRVWTSHITKTLRALHHGGLLLNIKVRPFQPPYEEGATDDRGIPGNAARPMYDIPWAIVDPEMVTRDLHAFTDHWIESYIKNLLKPSDDLVWPVYQEAAQLMRTVRTLQRDNRHSPRFPRLTIIFSQNPLIRDTMRLWIGARLADRGWRCFGSDDLGASRLPNHLRPPHWIPLPPYLDYQLVAVVMNCYLLPLKKTVLRQLFDAIKGKNPADWYPIFLSCFVLLHSCEMTAVIIRKHAAKRKSPVRYIIMELVKALNEAARNIVAHFRHCCKDNRPFARGFDWSSPAREDMAQLDLVQLAFMKRFVQAVDAREHIFTALRHTDHYEAPYWYVCQLFEPNWEPRSTLDASPASDATYLAGTDFLVLDDGAKLLLGPYERPDIEEDSTKRPNWQPWTEFEDAGR
ncbi:hypothetical protein C8A05DRAFT_20010 [Staphylotrichum tortipilum]|uniref:Zn(2)-C6 fungal-type domain-containing protein n=1 Tax=Staphylotrichum tortipilum TaxID=2831512 RepID=A0AAN6RNP1_9PEZI|nr:hypothetical protein C8A05DRAFT_20010 [Staphylotrichum longicolle]